jgi:hypothetical protein
MIKKLYVFAWLFLIGAVASSIFRGTLSELAMVAFAVIALGLIHAMALWAALVTTKHAQPH